MAVREVEDYGIAIPPEDRARVFERFQRASNVVGRIRGKKGLRLWGARQIIEQHGGGLTAESEAGVGTVFRVSIPRTQARTVKLTE